MTRLIVTDGATYEQRTAGTSNTGSALTEVAEVEFADYELGYRPISRWLLLDPDQAEPRVGDRWTLRVIHGKYTLTDTVNEIVGDL